MQLVIVEDFSTDATSSLISKWMKENPSFEATFISNTQNVGLVASLNSALACVQTDFVAILSGDDQTNIDQLQQQVELLGRSDESVGLVYGDLLLMDALGNNIGEWGWGLPFRLDSRKHDAYLELLRYNFLPSIGTVIRHRVFDQLGGYDTDFDYEDYGFWVKAARSFDILYLPGVAGSYRISEGSLSNAPSFSSQMKSTEIGILEKEIGHSKRGDKIIIRRLLGIALSAKAIGDAETWNLAKQALGNHDFGVGANFLLYLFGRLSKNVAAVIFATWNFSYRFANGVRLLTIAILPKLAPASQHRVL